MAIAPQEPQVQLTVENQLADFLADTGANYSVLNCKLASLSKSTASVVGLSGQTQQRPLLQPLECKIGEEKLKHNFLYVLDCLIPLLGRDLGKVNVQITFSPEKQLLRLEARQNCRKQISGGRFESP